MTRRRRLPLPRLPRRRRRVRLPVTEAATHLAAKLAVTTAELHTAQATIEQQTRWLADAATAARLQSAEHQSAITVLQATVAAAARGQADPTAYGRDWLRDRRLSPPPGADPARLAASERRSR